MTATVRVQSAVCATSPSTTTHHGPIPHSTCTPTASALRTTATRVSSPPKASPNIPPPTCHPSMPSNSVAHSAAADIHAPPAAERVGLVPTPNTAAFRDPSCQKRIAACRMQGFLAERAGRLGTGRMTIAGMLTPVASVARMGPTRLVVANCRLRFASRRGASFLCFPLDRQIDLFTLSPPRFLRQSRPLQMSGHGHLQTASWYSVCLVSFLFGAVLSTGHFKASPMQR
jgi:hypothetical protein